MTDFIGFGGWFVRDKQVFSNRSQHPKKKPPVVINHFNHSLSLINTLVRTLRIRSFLLPFLFVLSNFACCVQPPRLSPPNFHIHIFFSILQMFLFYTFIIIFFHFILFYFLFLSYAKPGKCCAIEATTI